MPLFLLIFLAHKYSTKPHWKIYVCVVEFTGSFENYIVSCNQLKEKSEAKKKQFTLLWFCDEMQCFSTFRIYFCVFRSFFDGINCVWLAHRYRATAHFSYMEQIHSHKQHIYFVVRTPEIHRFLSTRQQKSALNIYFNNEDMEML